MFQNVLIWTTKSVISTSFTLRSILILSFHLQLVSQVVSCHRDFNKNNVYISYFSRMCNPRTFSVPPIFHDWTTPLKFGETIPTIKLLFTFFHKPTCVFFCQAQIFSSFEAKKSWNWSTAVSILWTWLFSSRLSDEDLEGDLCCTLHAGKRNTLFLWQK